MQPTELPLRDQLKGTLIVLAWLTVALLLRDSNRLQETFTPNREAEPHLLSNLQSEASGDATR